MPRKAIVISSPPTVVVPLSSPPPTTAAPLPPFLLRADAPGRMLTRRFLKEMEEAPGATENVASQLLSTTAAVTTTSGNATSSSLTIISSRPARNVGGRSGSNTTTTPNTSTPTISMRGGFRCICRSFLLSHSDEMMECIECKNWSHAACMEVDPLTIKAARRTFVCFFCTGEAAKRQARRIEEGRLAPPPPPKHSVVLKLTECPDVVPSTNGKELDASLRRLVEYVASIGFEFIFVGKPSPPSSSTSTSSSAHHHHHHSDSNNAFTDSFMEQSLACCASAIHSATFSETYPSWCLSELRSPPHGYLQGTFMRCIKTRRVVSLVLSNGMDGYGGLRSAVSRLRMIHTKAVNKGDVSWMEGHSEGQASSSTPSSSGPSFVELCLGINDVSPYVHINLIATHPHYRGRGLAKALIAAELLRWALRGRSKAYLNMALDKKLVDNDTRVTCTASPASRRLYDTFGFRPVLPSRPLPPTNAVSSSTTTAQHQVGGGDNAATNVGEFYSAKEKDSGRVMVSLGFVSTVLQVVSSMLLNNNVTSNSGGSGVVQDQVPTPSTSAALSAAAGVEVLDDVVVLPTPSPPPARRGRGGGAGAAKRGRQ